MGNRSLADCRRVLSTSGVYLMSFGQPEHDWLGPFATLIKARVTSRFVSQRLIELTWKRSPADMEVLKELLEREKLKSVNDGAYPLSEAPEAMAYLLAGHARRKVIITV
jgi:NADPH:quinone reductase-like Zn-dependent oxidoreductase